jgi:rubrerythrin
MGAAESVEERKSIKAWRCSVCGEVTLSAKRPSECAFCGADSAYIDVAEDVPADLNHLQGAPLDERDRENLEASLAAELADSERYFSMAAEIGKNPECIWQQAMFKRLARVEAEHASIFSKLLSTSSEWHSAVGTAGSSGRSTTGDVTKAHAESIAGEEAASGRYSEYARGAHAERLAYVWCALAAVEQTHHWLLAGKVN